MSGFLRGTPGVPWLPASRDRAVDLTVAAVATALNVAGAVAPDPTVAYDVAVGHPLQVVLSAAAGVALLVRRTHPLTVFVAVAAITTVVIASDWQHGNLPITLLLAGYALGAFGTPASGVAGLAFVGGCFGLLFATAAPYFDSPLGISALGQVVAAWLLGAAVARSRKAGARAEERAARLAREGARETERAVLAERLRVARELNAAVTDAMTAITVQAAAGRRDSNGSGLLTTIERTSRGATEDLRRLLRALREPGTDDVEHRDTSSAGASSWWSGASPVDLALGGCVVLFNVTGSVLSDPSTTLQYDDPVLPALVALAAVPGLALIVRRRYPVAVLAAVLGALFAVTALGWQTGTLGGSVLIATYAVGAWAPVGRGLVALGGMATALSVVAAADLPSFDREGYVWGTLVIFSAPWVVGVVIRRHRIADQAQVEQALAAEREQAAATERALAEERLAVARDLHDLVSHNLAAITVQAAAARRRAEGGETTLDVIERTGRAAMVDLRRMLDTLSRPEAGLLGPAPGLADLESLVDRHRRAHGPVDLSVDGSLEQEPDSLRTTAFRVVQESLTNVGRHAPGSPAVVRLRATDSGVRVDVENERPAPGARPQPGSGWGLAGMRERITLIGGTLTAAETSDGGFAVRAELDRRAER